jgi:sugar lactone lactonase YvrE
MIPISAKPLLDFGESLGIDPRAWRSQREEMCKISTREILVQVTDVVKVAKTATALVADYGAALKEATLTIGDWVDDSEDNQEPFGRKGDDFKFQPGWDPTALKTFLADPELGRVKLFLTLEIDKDRLIANWLQQQHQAVPSILRPRLVFFRETLEALFQDTLAALATWWDTESPGKLVILCSEWTGLINGPYLAVANTWNQTLSECLPGGTPDKPDDLSPQDLHEARAKGLNWPREWLPTLTPLHLDAEDKEKASSDDVVANARRVHAINLCILYTANRIEMSHEVQLARDWSAEWKSIYQGADLVVPAPPSRLLGEEGARAAHALTELVKWCYGKVFPGDKLSFFQGAVARTLRERDLQKTTFDTLVAESVNLRQNIEPNWTMFVDGKLHEFDDQVRALEDYVAATVRTFADQIAALIKNLSDTALAAIAVLLGAFIATLIKKDATPEILAVSVSVYLIYLLVFPLIYNMRERWESYGALVRQFEERRERFNISLSKAKVDTIIGVHVDQSRKRFRRWFWLIVVTYLVVAAVLWCLIPSPVDSVAYQPTPALELTGPLQPNHELQNSRPIAPGRLEGAEDVAVDAAGRLYTGTADGKVMRVTLAPDHTERLEVFTDTGGRPLGLRIREGKAAAQGTTAVPWTLFVADARKGLLAIDANGGVKPLATAAGGIPFGFTNDLDVAIDGKIYFSDSSSRFGIDRYLYDLLESRPHGRLLVYDPSTDETHILLDGLFFANGVALSSGADFVLVAETYRYRIRRYWLKGPRAGTSDVFLDNLPGFPDNLSTDRGTGHFWVALFTVRNRIIDHLHPHPVLKEQLAKLPSFLWPKPEPYGLVLEFDGTGKVLRSLHDPGGQRVRGVTSAEPYGGKLYLGSLDSGITLWPSH